MFARQSLHFDKYFLLKAIFYFALFIGIGVENARHALYLRAHQYPLNVGGLVVPTARLYRDATVMIDIEYDDRDEDEQLSPALAAQLARWEKQTDTRDYAKKHKHHRTLKIRRDLEDWEVNRRIRDEIDYL